MESIKGKTVVVTGGASGIGKATAKRFAEEGASVAVLDIQKEAGRILAAEFRSDGGTAEFFSCDMGREEEIEGAMKKVYQRFGRIDILVGNAGIAEKKSLLPDMDMDSFYDVLRINLIGVILSNKHAVEYMMKNEGEQKGAVVNVASILGTVGADKSIAYPTAKAGVINFTKAQAVTYAKLGIRFNCVSPGYVDTPLLSHLPADLIASKVALHPMARFAKPEEIAEAILFLASPAASFITGSNLLVDGGYTAV